MQGPGLGKSRSAAHILLPAFFHFLVSSTTKLEEPVVNSIFGAGGRIRTGDLRITSASLCLLSYTSVCPPGGFPPSGYVLTVEPGSQDRSRCKVPDWGPPQ